jgi:hypothetical protein
MKNQKKKDRGLAVQREVVRFLGTPLRDVRGGGGDGGYCGTTGSGCGCSATGCTNSWEISY